MKIILREGVNSFREVTDRVGIPLIQQGKTLIQVSDEDWQKYVDARSAFIDAAAALPINGKIYRWVPILYVGNEPDTNPLPIDIIVPVVD